MSGRATEPSNELSRAREGSHKRICGVGHRDEPAFQKSFAGDDDIFAGVTTQRELVNGLMKLLKLSDASVDKATGLVEQLMDDNAKLLKLVAEKEEEAAGWKMLHEKSSASEMALKAVVEELMGGLRKLLIEHEQEVERRPSHDQIHNTPPPNPLHPADPPPPPPRNLASSCTAQPPLRSTTARQRSSPSPTAGVAPHHRSSSAAAHANPPSTGPQAAAAPNYPPPAEALQPANRCRRRPPSRVADTPPLRRPKIHCILLPWSPHSRAAPPSTPSATIVIAKPHHRRTPSSVEGLRRSKYVLRSCTSSPSRLHQASSDRSASSTSPQTSRPRVGPPLQRADLPAEHPFPGHRCLLYFIGQVSQRYTSR
ncbi:SH3 and multiple ankyrin repeat domains protein 1-like [Triticum urartu]|uniref:SH3 and multiple ankyrin repeat domains protein 1-like n=1 Tax=Triticum urartu TaxID=4572 RepID=UPI002043BE01|nr:SH3 and multiple ankyrin repeat domains protein 1-like [Triticum urartu]